MAVDNSHSHLNAHIFKLKSKIYISNIKQPHSTCKCKLKHNYHRADLKGP